jgi:hypothetical protein
MNTHEPAPTRLCTRMELLLPVLDDGDLDASSRAAALEHLRTCAYCQREHGRYLALDQALRDRFGLASARPRATEEIMQRINERTQQPNSATYMSPHQPAHPAPIPPHRAGRSSRPWLSSLGAAAVVVLLLGLAAMLFSGRLGLGVGGRGGPVRPSFAGTRGIIADVSMVSPTEGWALAQVTKSADGSSVSDAVTFYHYHNGVWTPTMVSLSSSSAAHLNVGGPGGFNGSISMDSATDGWAVASNFNNGSVLFHYTHGAWHEAGQGLPTGYVAGIQATSAHSAWAFSNEAYNGQPSMIVHFDGTQWSQQAILGMPDHAGIRALQMASDHLGWALIYVGNNGISPSDAGYEIAQYTGGNTWSSLTTLDAGNLGDIGGFAMISPDEGWAIGERGIDGPSSVTDGVPVPQILYHYSHGKWQQVGLHVDNGGRYFNLQSIVMRSATDGWIIGQVQNLRPGITASGIEKRTILLHYDGKTWTQVQTPVTGGDVSMISGISFAGDTGWAGGFVAALPDGQDVQDDTVSTFGTPMLWHYINGSWTLYQQQ